MYMQVESRTGTRLHLKRSPSIRSWALLVGISSVGLAAAYYSSDSPAWKLFYVAGCLFVAVQNLEDWEEAIFDRREGRATLRSFNLYRKLLTLCHGGQEQAVVLLRDIRDISVQEEKVRYFGAGYLIVLRLLTGISHPLTHSAVLGGRSDVEAVARLLSTFLGLDVGGFRPRPQESSSDSDDTLDKDEE
ncbi:cytochrome b-245 chaperone 1 [Gastrophryne carolinensis]